MLDPQLEGKRASTVLHRTLTPRGGFWGTKRALKLFKHGGYRMTRTRRAEHFASVGGSCRYFCHGFGFRVLQVRLGCRQLPPQLGKNAGEGFNFPSFRNTTQGFLSCAPGIIHPIIPETCEKVTNA